MLMCLFWLPFHALFEGPHLSPGLNSNSFNSHLETRRCRDAAGGMRVRSADVFQWEKCFFKPSAGEGEILDWSNIYLWSTALLLCCLSSGSPVVVADSGGSVAL